MARRYGPVAIMLVFYILVLWYVGSAVHGRHNDLYFVTARTLPPNWLVRDADFQKCDKCVVTGAGNFWKVREIERTVKGRYTKVEVPKGARLEPESMLRDSPMVDGKSGQLIALSLKGVGDLESWINAGTSLLVKCVEHCDSFKAEVVAVVCGGATAKGQAQPCTSILNPKSAPTKFDATSKFDLVIEHIP